MYTKRDLMTDLAHIGVNPRGTLLIHSSMKSIGPVEGGADTVLDALSDYMKDGLLVLPTLTWSSVTADHNVFDVLREPCCVGILPELFRQRPGVIRSLHPTHSVAALGKDAPLYVAGEEYARTPCARRGCWGKLYDRGAQILFLGCTLKSNTFIHGVEEWNHIPNRLNERPEEYVAIAPDGVRCVIPQYRHNASNPSRFYDKMEPVFLEEGAIRYSRLGDAKCILGDAVAMAEITTGYLRCSVHLFDDATPITAFRRET